MSARVAAGGDHLGQLVRTRQDLAEQGAAVDRALIAAVSRPAQARKFDAEAALQQQAAEITTTLKEVDTALERSFPQHTSLANPAPAPLTEIASLVGPSEALLLFVPTRDGTFLWATTAAQSRWIKVPLTSSELATRVTALRCGLDYLGEWRGEATGKCTELLQPAFEPDRETALPFDLARAHELYAALFNSVEDLIVDKQLLIVPSGRSPACRSTYWSRSRHRSPSRLNRADTAKPLGLRSAPPSLCCPPLEASRRYGSMQGRAGRRTPLSALAIRC